MIPFLRQLRTDLNEREDVSLRRTLQTMPGGGRHIEIDGRRLLNLAGNDYLGLADHPRLAAAATEAIQRYGTGAGASRLVVGHFDLHDSVERRFTAFKHGAGRGSEEDEDDAWEGRSVGGWGSLLLPTGYMANLAVLTTLAGSGDLICVDKLCHASLIDGARAGGAMVRVYPHLHDRKLERLLKRHAEEGKGGRNALGHPRHEVRDGLLHGGGADGGGARDGGKGRAARRFIVTEAVFSMDGEVADLPRLCELARRYEATVIVDEAHATGVLGAHGRGLCEAQGVIGRVGVVVSTASKALGGLGGLVTAPRPVIETLVNHARPFIYTTGVPPAQAAAIGAALDVIEDEPWRRTRLMDMAARVRRVLADCGWPLPTTRPATPIVPLRVDGAEAALALADHLRGRGVMAVAIRPPTVPPGSSRVRLSLRTDLDDRDVDRLLEAVGRPAHLKHH